jgi:hypothetical protein
VFTLKLLGVALVAWLLSAIYTLRFNPEIAFFRRASELKHAWSLKLDQGFKQKVVVFGGSSCLVSIDGATLLAEKNLPVLNLGLGAGMGASVLTEYALSRTRPGDVLVMAMEPGLLTTALDKPALGVQFCYASDNCQLLKLNHPLAWISTSLDLRPSAYHVFTLIGKVALRQPLYRYRQDELQPCGWHRLDLQRDFQPDAPWQFRLSPDAIGLLGHLRNWCAEHKVRLAYSLPWAYATPLMAEAQRRVNATFLAELAEHLPVLKDPLLGVHTTRSDFADTMWHLRPEAAQARSRQFAQQVQQWSLWSKHELQEFAHEKSSAQD